MFVANTYLYVPPRRYVFSGAEAFGRLAEETDDNDDDSSLDSEDNSDGLSDVQRYDDGGPSADGDDNNHPGDFSYPQTPPDLAYLDSSSGSLDP